MKFHHIADKLFGHIDKAEEVVCLTFGLNGGPGRWGLSVILLFVEHMRSIGAEGVFVFFGFDTAKDRLKLFGPQFGAGEGLVEVGLGVHGKAKLGVEIKDKPGGVGVEASERNDVVVPYNGVVGVGCGALSPEGCALGWVGDKDGIGLPALYAFVLAEVPNIFFTVEGLVEIA